MSTVRATIERYWKPLSVVTAGVLALLFMKNNAYQEVTQELIALFGLMMAAVLPTMVLTASVLRGGNLSIKRLNAYRDALMAQLKIWVGLFLVSFAASFFVIVGKMVGWSVPLTLRFAALNLDPVSYDLVAGLNALITACLGLLIVRALAVGRGIISLLRLSGEIAASEAQARDQQRFKAAEERISAMPTREGFGQYLDLKH